MATVDWHWAVTNAGPEKLFVWLEPWAEEFEVPPRSTIALTFNSEDDPAQIEVTPDRMIVWAGAGQTAQVFIDDALQESGSASIPVPGGFDGSTKELLTLIFGGHPEARLGGEKAELHTGAARRRERLPLIVRISRHHRLLALFAISLEALLVATAFLLSRR